MLSCRNQTDKQKNDPEELIIFHAGSLSVPVKQICESFQVLHPEVVFKPEAAGSVASARKITDLNRYCDVFLSADYGVIDKFLIPDFANWNIKFASNEMVVVFSGKSRYSNQINLTNWPEILLKDDVNFGRSDPNSDPCGYRTVITLELAAKILKTPDFAQQILEKDTRFIRPKEVDLIALLETQTVDYIFIYRSVAVQHQLQYLVLQDSINLKNPALKDWYSSSQVEINGKQPGDKIIQKGEAMIYGLTIPKNSPNPGLALEFVTFLLEADQGMQIMAENGQPSLVPSPANGFDKIPVSLRKFALAEK